MKKQYTKPINSHEKNKQKKQEIYHTTHGYYQAGDSEKKDDGGKEPRAKKKP